MVTMTTGDSTRGSSSREILDHETAAIRSSPATATMSRRYRRIAPAETPAMPRRVGVFISSSSIEETNHLVGIQEVRAFTHNPISLPEPSAYEHLLVVGAVDVELAHFHRGLGRASSGRDDERPRLAPAVHERL